MKQLAVEPRLPPVLESTCKHYCNKVQRTSLKLTFTSIWANSVDDKLTFSFQKKKRFCHFMQIVNLFSVKIRKKYQQFVVC